VQAFVRMICCTIIRQLCDLFSNMRAHVGRQTVSALLSLVGPPYQLLLPLTAFKYDVKKGKVFPYSLPSVGPGADPGVQAVSPQVT